ncbi:MAG: hypothetical protein QNJ32_02235 [Xenococcaceae cyanobacterium MO_167.B27]|nr:hypothetical protein [Xenococcaceae cyanobacterium MO_167.B27]
MRIYLYLLAGITSALLGWNLGQIFLTDFGFLQQFPEIVLFPCVAISLAIGMVLNEIFISNPTRPKRSFYTARVPLLIALVLGLLAGLVAGGISQILFLPSIPVPTPIVRSLGWLLIGASVGLAEGLTWRWHSTEAGDKKRSRHRLIVSLMGGIIASFLAALLFEFIRSSISELPSSFKAVEDPLGFTILGLLLGLTFGLSNSPSYMVALRAGAGFEYTGEIFEDIEPRPSKAVPTYPRIAKSMLRFISDSEEEKIEEGLSIQLPSKGKLIIGSSPEAHIRIPGLPHIAANLELKARQTSLIPNNRHYSSIEVNGDRLSSRRALILKHNDLLTFHPVSQHESDEEKFYRFVYYNRFLDPQA